MKLGGIVGNLLEAAESKAGMVVMPRNDAQLLEAAWDELRATNRELDMIGWQVLDYLGGQPQEITTMSRRKMVQRARYVWMNDPQAGASVSLMNDFVFGRGVPNPRAKDEAVQNLFDGFWSDPDNKRAITTYAKQITLGTDLALQSNLFFLVFDDGDDGKVKMAVLDHDTVENCVRDPENPNRVLYWLVRPRKVSWDFRMDRPDVSVSNANLRPIYYEDFSGLKEAKEEQEAGARDEPVPLAPSDRVGKGRVYHIAVNRFSGQVFGVPEFQRTIRWYSAYNDFMKARVDMAQASAAFIMKRKIKGSATQLAKMASRALSNRSDLSGALDQAEGMQAPPRPGSILDENENLSHENFKIDSGAGNAATDAHMIRAPISAATRFPQSYYGDETNTSLATATSLELPVLKAVESRQEMFEQMFRDMLDLVIERAVDSGNLTEERTPEEIQKMLSPEIDAQLNAARVQYEKEGKELVEAHAEVVGSKHNGFTLRYRYFLDEDGTVVEAHEDKAVDETDTKRDLGYEFSMPSPLRRMMGDLVTAVQTIAATFDPNNTNTELTRALATVVFGEALEIQDPADLVDKIWPAGYVDPMLAAAQASQAPAAPSTNQFGPEASAQFPQSRLPEDLTARSGPYSTAEAVDYDDDLVRTSLGKRKQVVADEFDAEVAAIAADALKRHLASESEEVNA